MVKVNKFDGIGHVQKCGGIPMYPKEYNFDMEPPEGYSEEDDRIRIKHLAIFLEKCGLKMPED